VRDSGVGNEVHVTPLSTLREITPSYTIDGFVDESMTRPAMLSGAGGGGIMVQVAPPSALRQIYAWMLLPKTPPKKKTEKA
jgi:hypothetical protein